jgi:hypothetical protein
VAAEQDRRGRHGAQVTSPRAAAHETTMPWRPRRTRIR